MKTSSSILLRTSFVLAVAARMTGMNTPRTSVVIRIVANAARLGAALRLSARNASLRKKPTRIRLPSAGCARQVGREHPVRAVAAGALVAHDPPLVELDHAPAHAIDHLAIVGRDDHGR